MAKVGRAAETQVPQPLEAVVIAPETDQNLFQDAYDFVERHPIASAATVGVLSAGIYAASRYIPYAITQRTLSAVAKTLNPEDVRIVPLTAENLPKAIEAGKDGFRYGMGFLNPAADFKASLTPMVTKMHAGQREMNARYFLAVDKENRVLGTTGLYQTAKDQGEALWVGWMSVRPAFRGKGIGQKLVDFSIDEAKKQNVDYLRLYTSTYRGERAAQPLYEKAGFKVVGEMKHELPIPGLKYLFRELPLKPIKAASA
jgi:GNAT superfamily N-acetyltransferase